jgi:hypothetical protein
MREIGRAVTFNVRSDDGVPEPTCHVFGSLASVGQNAAANRTARAADRAI